MRELYINESIRGEETKNKTGIFGCRCFFGDFKIFGNR